MKPITHPKLLKTILLASPVISGLLGILIGYMTSTPPTVIPKPTQQVQASLSAEPNKPEQTITLPSNNTGESPSAAEPAASTWVTMWEGAAQTNRPPRAEPLTPPNWSFRGTIQNGSDSQVMIQFERDPQLRFIRVGEKLPGGSLLLWARPDAIGVRTPQNKTIEIALNDSPTAPVQTPPASSTTLRRP
jgi:hypothetical protein